ncbi:MAG: hypothetical protein Q9179_000148 [Wetmoreana sp. 5 TL-2023]
MELHDRMGCCRARSCDYDRLDYTIDNDLVQGVTERVIEENRWVSTHWPGRPQIGNEALLWRQECDAIDEVLQNHLANLKTWGRYARLAEGRARIGVDEVSFSLLFLGYRARTAKLMLYWTKCRAAIAQHDAESNLKLAEETKFLTQNSKADSRSLTRLQYLAMISLPLSLSSSIFGMGFFSTSTGPSGEPRLLVSPRWWYYLALAVPMTALTVVALYFMVAWEALRERSRSAPCNIVFKRSDIGRNANQRKLCIESTLKTPNPPQELGDSPSANAAALIHTSWIPNFLIKWNETHDIHYQHLLARLGVRIKPPKLHRPRPLPQLLSRNISHANLPLRLDIFPSSNINENPVAPNDAVLASVEVCLKASLSWKMSEEITPMRSARGTPKEMRNYTTAFVRGVIVVPDTKEDGTGGGAHISPSVTDRTRYRKEQVKKFWVSEREGEEDGAAAFENEELAPVGKEARERDGDRLGGVENPGGAASWPRR